MRFELKGREYTTKARKRTVRFTEVRTQVNGKNMACNFSGLREFPSQTEVYDFMLSQGAKVVKE